MRDYEAVYIFDSALDDARINEKLERYHALVAGENGGQITAVDHWGKRQLAYAIADRDNGYYVVAQFRTEPEKLTEFERILKLDEELLRFLIVINEGELTTSPFATRPEPSSEEEDGEEEE